MNITVQPDGSTTKAETNAWFVLAIRNGPKKEAVEQPIAKIIASS